MTTHLPYGEIPALSSATASTTRFHELTGVLSSTLVPNHLVTEVARKRRTRRARPVKKHHEGADGDDAMKPIMTPEITLESTKSATFLFLAPLTLQLQEGVQFNFNLISHSTCTCSRLVYQERRNNDDC